MPNKNKEIADLLKNPAASNWLKTALRTALSRDVADAANDARLLSDVLERRSWDIQERAFGFTRNPI